MIETTKQLILKISILAIGAFILHQLVTLIGVLLYRLYYPDPLWIPLNVHAFLDHILPLLKLLPVIALAAGLWTPLDKVKTRTLVILLALLVILMVQPIRMHLRDEIKGAVKVTEEESTSAVDIPDKLGTQSSYPFKIVKARREPHDQYDERHIVGKNETVYINPEPLLTNKDIKKAHVEFNHRGKGFNVRVILTEKGGKRFTDITTKYEGEHLAVIVGGKIVQAPEITAPIHGNKLLITGPFNKQEARQIAQGIVTE